MFGYVICDVEEAFKWFNDPRVRFVAELSNGAGFIAFDGEKDGLEDLGSLFMVFEPIPDYPPSWPDSDKKAAPKRGVSNGTEHFGLVSEEDLNEIIGSNVTGLVKVTEAVWLVECTGEPVPGAWWSGAVIRFQQKPVKSHLTVVE